ncbi:unnamed protein product [Taenia asiatica]|uniref:Wsv094 n=1 Tax=Taenia asiatica TaxID=60517 RepID=A0A0R3WFJ7_TAEAS|nr:unnamed protein product [Taenia asiatica]
MVAGVNSTSHLPPSPLLSSPLLSSHLLSSLLISSPLFSFPLLSSPLLYSTLLSLPTLHHYRRPTSSRRAGGRASPTLPRLPPFLPSSPLPPFLSLPLLPSLPPFLAGVGFRYLFLSSHYFGP